MFLWHDQDPRCAHILLSTTVHKDYDEILLKHPDYRNKITNIPTAMTDDIGETDEPRGEGKSTVSHSPEESSTTVASPPEVVDSGKVDSPHIVSSHWFDTAPRTWHADFLQQGQYAHFEHNKYVTRTPPNPNLKASDATIRPLQDRRSSQAGFIPINAAGHRIDALLRPPTQDEHIKFKQRTKQKNLCTSFHLTGYCPVNHCRFDHSSIALPVLHVLKQKVRGWPCTAGGGCRRADCFHGHVCFAKGCLGGRHPGCKFSLEAHGVDLNIIKWVKPGVVEELKVVEVDIPAGPYGKATKEAPEDNSWFKTGASKASMESWPAMVQDLIEI